jgi:hypothetical protein
VDVFEYHCARHGVVASFERLDVPGARPPIECPTCGEELRLEVLHAYGRVAAAD